LTLFFYSQTFRFSPVCGDEMVLFNEILPEFEKFNAVLLGVSVDSVWCHLAFSKDRKLRFPLLLADFHPHHNQLLFCVRFSYLCIITK
jgi:peroxiredoxin